MPENTATENEEIVTLTAPDGEDVDFYELGVIELNGAFYAVLQPVELPEDMEPDEALVFKVVQNEDGEENLVVEGDDAIIDAVFEKYNSLVEAQK